MKRLIEKYQKELNEVNLFLAAFGITIATGFILFVVFLLMADSGII